MFDCFKKKKRYEYVESPAVKETRTALRYGTNFASTGNKLKNVTDKTFTDITFDGGELQVLLENCHRITFKSCIFKNVTSENGHFLLGYNSTFISLIDCVFKHGILGNSEGVAINTGCTDWLVNRCYFHDIDNIPLDIIAGERDDKYTGRISITNNDFLNCGYRQDYWTTAGPYVDGASDVLIENNCIDGLDMAALGIEIGAENKRTATNLTVMNNRIEGIRKHGILYGSYKKKMGGVDGVTFAGNTFLNCENNYKAQYNCKNVVIT